MAKRRKKSYRRRGGLGCPCGPGVSGLGAGFAPAIPSLLARIPAAKLAIAGALAVGLYRKAKGLPLLPSGGSVAGLFGLDASNYRPGMEQALSPQTLTRPIANVAAKGAAGRLALTAIQGGSSIAQVRNAYATAVSSGQKPRLLKAARGFAPSNSIVEW